MADSPDAIKRSLRLYLIIGATLFVCTLLTVGVAFFDLGARGFDPVDMWVGLAIASFKVVLVAAIFMHLNHEKKSIYYIFFGSLFFAFSLYHLTELAEKDPINDRYFYQSSASAGHAVPEPAKPTAPAPAPAPAPAAPAAAKP